MLIDCRRQSCRRQQKESRAPLELQRVSVKRRLLDSAAATAALQMYE
jgi:hypothetical protein